MAAINWLIAVSDDFSDAVRWAGGVVPGNSDDAIFGVLGGGAYTVTAQSFTGLATSRHFDLANVNFAASTLTCVGNTTSGVLTVGDGTTTSTMKLTSHYTQGSFAKTNDGGGHVDTSYNGASLAAGPPSIDVGRFASTMASLGGGTASSANLSSGGGPESHNQMLAIPQVA